MMYSLCRFSTVGFRVESMRRLTEEVPVELLWRIPANGKITVGRDDSDNGESISILKYKVDEKTGLKEMN